MKNNRIMINEADTAVDTVSLQDLLTASSKAQGIILQLQTTALSFSNKRIMTLATKLNSDAAEFHNYIAQLVIESGGQTPSSELAPEEEEDTRQNLSAPTGPDSGQSALESVRSRYLKKKKIKKEINLSESFEKIGNFKEFKSDVIKKLEESIDLVEKGVGKFEATEFIETIENLNEAKSADEFDTAFNTFYDFADKYGILVETTSSLKQRI